MHGNGAAERFRGGPWDFREGLLRRAAETVRPADLFKWDLELGDNMALSLEHRDTRITIPLLVAQNIVEGKVLQLSAPHAASSSSSDTALSHFETEAYWTTAPTVLDGEPMNPWVSLYNVTRFLFPDNENKSRKCSRSFEGWRKILEKVGLDPEHAQRSRRSSDKRARTEDGFEPSSEAMASMDWRITVPGLTMLLTCFTISGRYQKEMGDTEKLGFEPYCKEGWTTW